MFITDWIEENVLKKEEKQKRQEQKEAMEALMENALFDINNSMEELAGYSPGSSEYEALQKRIDSLTTDYDKLFSRYNQTFYPEKKNRDLDWTKIICTTVVTGCTIWQSLAIFKWQRDGYLISRDVQKLQMPKVNF